jgi:hypothetical protein
MVNRLEYVAAQKLLEMEEVESELYPNPKRVIVEWKNRKYLGLIQEIDTNKVNCPKGLVYLSKTERHLSEKLVEAIEELDPDRLYLKADSTLNLEGEEHFLRMVGDRLSMTTLQQKNYVFSTPLLFLLMKMIL